MIKFNLIANLIMIFKGILVGFGAIMPGISGGTLCVAFGMYHIILELLSHPFKTLKEHWQKLLFFILGGGIGFVGLAGFAGWLMSINAFAVTCVFVGFILGTIPELWQGAGEQGRSKNSYIAMPIAFVVMLTILIWLKTGKALTLEADMWGYIFCGIMWALSFIVPGLSSSTLLLFFGLYQPMLEGIGSLNFTVLMPMAIGLGISFLILPKAVNAMYKKWYNVLSHIVLGIVVASTVSIVPIVDIKTGGDIAIAVVCIILGAVASYFATVVCAKLDNKE